MSNLEVNKSNGYKAIFLSVITIALPTMLEQIMSVLMQYVDTAMVGHLGAEATAAVSTSTSITWLIGGVPNAFGVAVMTLIAQAIGSGNDKEIKKVAAHSVLYALAVGLALEVICLLVSPFVAGWMGAEPSVAPMATKYFFWITVPVFLKAVYLIFAAAIRATKDTKTPMYIGICANLINVVLNYILIYVAGLGVAGAAYASCISTVIQAGAMVVAFVRNPVLGFRLKEFEISKQTVARMWKLSFPVLVINVASCMGYVVFAGMVSHMGTMIFAAHSIALGAEELFYIGGYGFKSAANTLVGISYGEQNYKKYHRVCISSIVCTLVVMIFSGAILFIFAENLMRFFTNDASVVALGTVVLKMVAFNEPFFGMYVISEGIYYGLGRTKYPLAIEFSGMWLVRIVSTSICIHFFNADLPMIWCCMIADNVSKAILLTVPLKRLWKKSLNNV